MCVSVYTYTYIHIPTHIYTHIYVIECYSAIRKDEILPFATIWMDHEKITLSKISQSEKNQSPYGFSHMRTRELKLIDTNNSVVVTREGRGWEGGKG